MEERTRERRLGGATSGISRSEMAVSGCVGLRCLREDFALLAVGECRASAAADGVFGEGWECRL